MRPTGMKQALAHENVERPMGTACYTFTPPYKQPRDPDPLNPLPHPLPRGISYLFYRYLTVQQRVIDSQQFQVPAPSPEVVPGCAERQQGRVVPRAQPRGGRRRPFRRKPLVDVYLGERVQVLGGPERPSYRRVELKSRHAGSFVVVKGGGGVEGCRDKGGKLAGGSGAGLWFSR